MPHRLKPRWDLCNVTETRSDVTLSSGGSSCRPIFVPRRFYHGSSTASVSEGLNTDIVLQFRHVKKPAKTFGNVKLSQNT